MIFLRDSQFVCPQFPYSGNDMIFWVRDYSWETKKNHNSFMWLSINQCDFLSGFSGHCRTQRPRFFWSAPRIATSDPVQRHSVFEWLCKHNRLRPEPIRFVKLDSEHAQSDGKSVNRGLPVLDLARGRDSWC